MTAFQTRNGRTVYDGGGIKPDIEVEQEEVSNLIISLVRERLFFDFATLYKFQNPSLIGSSLSLSNDHLSISICDAFL